MSVCTNLTIQLSNLQELHSQLEALLADLDEEVTPQKLQDAEILKRHIKLLSTELESQTKESIDLVLKTKYNLYWKDQINIYTDLDQEEWAREIQAAKHDIMNRIKDPKNKPAIEARIKKGLIPILMPGRKTQRKNWQESLKNLKPYYRMNGVDKPVDDPVNFAQETWEELLNNPAHWSHIPEQPYIYWTIPTSNVALGLNQNLEEQKQTIKNSDPKLYGTEPAKDIHPLEYLSLQVMYTHQKQRQQENIKDIIPFDIINLTRFPSCGISLNANVLCADFFSETGLGFAASSIDGDRAAGVRIVGRL